MAFTSFGFIALVIGFVLLTSALPSPRGRSLVLLAASLCYVASCAPSAVELAPLASFLLFGYASIEGLRRSRSRAFLIASALLLVAGFVFLKQYAFLGREARLPFPYLTVGLSYVLFRLLHLMVDAQQGELHERVPLLSFSNYTLHFLSFTAGPIQLYTDFARDERQALVLTRSRVTETFARVVGGFVKVAVISAAANYAFATISPRLLTGTATLPLLVACATLYTTYLYANFAGYMDIVIGVGALAGWRFPENFDRPFRARSFLELWTRWHITLSNWFKIYLFNPLLKELAKRYPSSGAAPHLAVLAFFVTFLVMGLWHGGTSAFVVYGLFLALGASVNKWWQVLATRHLGKKAYKAWCERAAVAYACRGLTFAYFAIALTCFWVDTSQLVTLVTELGAAGLVGSFFSLAALGAVSFAFVDLMSARWFALRARAPAPPSFAKDLGLALQVLLVLSISSFFHKSPEFVYRAF